MPNRYSGMYDDYMQKLAQASRPNVQAEYDADQKRQRDEWLPNMASVALPIAGAAFGAAMGGPEGAKVGGGVGNAAGQAVGQMGQNAGANDMDPIRRKAMERQALMQAIANMR